MGTRITILDCTIRDGSYAVDYQFTLRDVATIGKALEQAGFPLIEIGHGVGLRGAEKGKGNMAETDEDYCKAASKVFSKAQWGMFFIPGIGELEDLDMAAKHGMHFCRIGINIDQIPKAAPFIKHAKSLGMTVCANLMKSYAVSAEDFGGYAAQAADFGADVVYLVDSAGGMFPDEVKAYISVAKAKTPVALGFHGHNNLSMAIANTIAAVEEGATYVDASLQGLGRSAGNTEMEPLLMVLERLGYETGIDALRALQIGERFVRPMIKAGRDELAVICGVAQFHSSYIPIITKIAAKHKVDPRKLILEVTKRDKLEAPEILVEEVAKKLAASGEKQEVVFDSLIEMNEEEESYGASLAKQVRSQAIKHGKRSVMAFGFGEETRITPTREGKDIVIGSIEAGSLAEADAELAAAEGKVDAILLDAGSRKGSIAELAKYWKRGIIPYDDHDTLTRSLSSFLLQMRSPEAERILIAGMNDESIKLCFTLCALGFQLTLWDTREGRAAEVAKGLAMLLPDDPSPEVIKEIKDSTGSSDIIIGMGGNKAAIGEDILDALGKKTMLIDGLRGSLTPSLIAAAKEEKRVIYRFDTRTGLAGVARSALETKDLVEKDLGTQAMKGYDIVAGGIIGAAGDIVVDSITEPRSVIGVADGKGGLTPAKECEAYKDRLNEAERWLLNKGLE